MSDHSISKVRYKAIADFPGYRVGDDGSVWSKWRSGTKDLMHPWKRMKLTKGVRGYRVVSLHKNKKNNVRYVHRLVLEAFVGRCPDGMECRHFPDRDPTNNRLANLSWGSPAENANDKIVHGTAEFGIKNHMAKLSESDIVAIRKKYATGKWYQRELAEKYSVSPSAISLICLGENWRHMNGISKVGRLAKRSFPGQENPNAKLNENQVRDIRAKHAEGISDAQLAKEYNVSAGGCIWGIIHGKTWKHLV